MKKLAIVLMILACVGFCACQKTEPPETAGQATTVSELSETTTRLTNHTESATEFTEVSPSDRLAQHESWRSKKDGLIRKAKDELTAKGWENLELTDVEAKYTFTYTIVASIDDRYNNPVTVWVHIYFSDVDSDGRVEVSYKSEAGRIYRSEEILSVNDPQLYDYMQSSYKNVRHANWHSKKDNVIKKAKDELTAKGWENLELITTEDKDLFQYIIVGSIDNKHNNPMSVRVSIFFSDAAPDGTIESISYESEAGRFCSSYDPYIGNELLPANDQQLYDYMHDS